MARRMLSTAVQVKPPPTDVLAIPRHLLLQVLTPSPTEVRDAVARVTRDLEDMRLKRGPDWEPDMETFRFNIDLLDNGEVVLRGTVEITRSDA